MPDSKTQPTARPRKIARKPLPLEVRRNDDGSLDEVVCAGAYVHLEQMSTSHWWLGVEHKGTLIYVNFTARGKITATCEEQ